MEIQLPQAVKEIINRLEQLGFEAYAVGGCVRDTMLHRVPGDWDITTSAKPEQVKAAFSRTIDTGIEHGTVTVMKNHIGYEVTTYRIDGEYEDNRHPNQVEFTSNLLLDLERRDFTINAMAYNERQGLVDAFDGIEDLKNRMIRCVGDPGQRFDEDALRMLRAVRFSGQLGFSIEEKTREAIIERSAFLKKISAERIRVELTKLMVSKDSGQIREAVKTGMTAVFLPELDQMMEVEQCNPHHIATVGEHSIHSMEIMNSFFWKETEDWEENRIPDAVCDVAQDIAGKCSEKQHQILCLTMLLHDVAKPVCMTKDENGIGHFYGHPAKSAKMAGQIMKRLTFDNDTIHAVVHLIRYHDEQIVPAPKPVRRAVSRIGKEWMELLFLVQFSDILAQNPSTFSEKFDRVLEVKKVYEQVLVDEAPLSIKELAVTGRDIIALGVSPGPRMGEILRGLLEEVLEEPSINTKEQLLDLVKDKFLPCH